MEFGFCWVTGTYYLEPETWNLKPSPLHPSTPYSSLPTHHFHKIAVLQIPHSRHNHLFPCL